MMAEAARKVARVVVPATCANLGPGFDVLGMAIGIFNEVEIEEFGEAGGTEGRVSIRVIGEGAASLPGDETNLVYRAAEAVYDATGREMPPVRLTLVNRIPLSRGLGSSSAAIVGGVLAANAILGQPLGVDDIFELAVRLEGHPDNVAPALFGGVVASLMGDSGLRHIEISLPADFEAGMNIVVCVPSFDVSTTHARSILPKTVGLSDAVFNIGRVALLVASLSQGRWDLLGEAMSDRLHQLHRIALVPGLGDVIRDAVSSGAAGAALSGSGPSVVAFVRGDVAGASMISGAMKRAFGRHDVEAVSYITKISAVGARVVPEGNLRDMAVASEQLVAGNLGLAVVRGGDVIFTSRESGIRPLLDAVLQFDGELEGSVIADKIVGRASALLCIGAGARAVYAPVMAHGAVGELARHGIDFTAGLVVPRILNHAGDDSCPFEKLTAGITDPGEALRAIQSFALSHLQREKSKNAKG
ncbi:MAG: homoserine kinase [Firmicutes bacterium]|nr:homoserine kinase [Bacillota bacterium]